MLDYMSDLMCVSSVCMQKNLAKKVLMSQMIRHQQQKPW